MPKKICSACRCPISKTSTEDLCPGCISDLAALLHPDTVKRSRKRKFKARHRKAIHNITCVCGDVFQAKSIIARWCKACRDKKTPHGALHHLQIRASRRGLLVTLNLLEVACLMNSPCHFCGGPVVGLHLDRLDPSKGYSRENAVSCCWPCNNMKGASSVSEFKEQISALYHRLDHF